jgi:hypothetical protein
MHRYKLVWMAGGAVLAVAGAVAGTVMTKGRAEASAVRLTPAGRAVPAAVHTMTERSDLHQGANDTTDPGARVEAG